MSKGIMIGMVEKRKENKKLPKNYFSVEKQFFQYFLQPKVQLILKLNVEEYNKLLKVTIKNQEN